MYRLIRLPALRTITVIGLLLPGCNDVRHSSTNSATSNIDSGAATREISDSDYDDAERLWRSGRLSEFLSLIVDKDDLSASATFKLLRVEGLLAVGRLAEAEQLAAEVSEGHEAQQDRQTLIRAHKLHVLAQLRQPKALIACEHTDSEDLADDELRSVSYWQKELAGELPNEISGDTSTLTMQPTPVWSGLVSHDFNSISVSVNGETMPITFIDTGAQWTILTTQAAALAGVVPDDANFTLTGFSNAVARPAVARELALGSLIVRNVPVLVADTAALVASKGQLTIGLDVLYHLRTTIDSGYGAVTFADAQEIPDPSTESANGGRWEIPVFNFSTAMLTEGRFRDDSARVLIDTGNAVGTFVSARWAERVLPQVRSRRPPPTLWFKKRKFELPAFELAGQRMERWPVVDSLPDALQQLDTVDLVMGRDLYSNYRVTIDLAHGRLVLDNGPLPPTPARKAVRSAVNEDAGTELSP